MMTLYGYWRSSASYRVRIALALKGIEVNHIAVNLRAAEQKGSAHLARNPQGFLPVLELEDGTQLTQSLAIMDYLDTAYPERKLLPDNPVLRAKIMAASLAIAADIHPIQNLSVLKFIRLEYGQDDTGVKAWAAHWISNGFKALESMVEVSGASNFVMDNPGFFECCLIPQVYNARRFGVDMDQFPTLKALDEACCVLPEFIMAAPENQPDSA